MKHKHSKHVIGNAYIFNCLFFIINLFIRGRLKALLILPPWHCGGITKRGNYIHFKTTKRRDRWSPFLFEGIIEVRRLEPVLRIKRNKK